MPTRRSRVAVVGSCDVPGSDHGHTSGVAAPFDLVRVEDAAAATGLLADASEDVESGDGDDADGGVDCVLCVPADVATVCGEDGAGAVVALVPDDGDDGDAARAIESGATDVLRADEPATVATARVENAIARERLPGVEADLEAERTLLSDIFERAPVHLYVKDAEGRHVRMSSTYVDDVAPFIGKTDRDLSASSTAEETYRDDMHVIETGEPILNKEEHIEDLDTDVWSVEYLRERFGRAPDREIFEDWVLTSKVPRYDDGVVVGLIGVTHDISERKEYQRQLEAQNEQLEEFAGIVSHDLRTPLSVATGNLALARADDAGDQRHLDRVADALGQIEDIVDDVLALARQSRSVEETQPVDLEATVESVWTTVGGDTAALDVGTLPTVRADGTRLQRLLENLLRNSVEHGSTNSRPRVDDADGRGGASDRTATRTDDVDDHTGPGVTVRIEWLDAVDGVDTDDADRGAGFAVDDDGPGIPPADYDRAFERGYTTSDDGTGFGLSIVRLLAEAHGWTVTVGASERGGARFEVRGVEHVDDESDGADGADAGREANGTVQSSDDSADTAS